jgi:hypothetical protein
VVLPGVVVAGAVLGPLRIVVAIAAAPPGVVVAGAVAGPLQIVVAIAAAPPGVVAVGAVAAPLGIAAGIAVALPDVVAVSAEAAPLAIAAGIVVVLLPLEISVLPEVVVGLLVTAVVIVHGASNLGHPRYFASPNVCSFPSCSSSVGPVGGVFVDSSIVALANDAPYSRSSNLVAPLYKKMERIDSSPNLHYISATDTIGLPTDATTNPCRKTYPHLSQGQHRHKSQVSLSPLEVRQIRWGEAEKCQRLHLPLSSPE